MKSSQLKRKHAIKSNVQYIFQRRFSTEVFFYEPNAMTYLQLHGSIEHEAHHLIRLLRLISIDITSEQQ